MLIEPLDYSDLALLPGVQPEGWSDITIPFRYYIKSSYCFPVKVSIDEQIVGVGAAIVHGHVGWLAHIIVQAGYRQRGIGSAITQSLIASAKSKGCDPIMLTATDLGEPVYRKLGFEVESEYLFFRDLKISEAYADEAIRPYETDYQQDLLAFDKSVSGEDRSADLLEHLAGSFVVINGERLEGFYLPTFGEGLIEACTPEVGLKLMRLRLSVKDFIAFPIENVAAATFMEAHGYKAFKRASRMRLGKPLSWQPQRMFSRVGGNLG